MHLIVTGASGFVGRALVPALARDGHSGVAVSRQRLAELPRGWTWEARDGLLADKRRIWPESSALVHLEVHHHVGRPQARDLALFEQINVAGTARWLNWCDAHNMRRFAFFSSINAVRPSPPVTFEEAQGPGPTAYGASKWAAELKVQDWVRQGDGRAALILRPAVVYGSGMAGNMNRMLVAIRRGMFWLVDGGACRKSVVSLHNLCAATGFLLARMGPGLERFNVTDPTTHSLRELASWMRGEPDAGSRFPNIPLWLAAFAARIGDGLAALLPWNPPITTPRLRALTQSTAFSCERLMALGFVHPETTRDAILALSRKDASSVS